MLLEPTALFTFADAPDHLRISGTECLQAGCPLCHPMNNIKALKGIIDMGGYLPHQILYQSVQGF